MAPSDFEHLFDASLDMRCVVGADGRFIRANASFQRCLGWSVDELIASPFAMLTHPDDVAATAGALAKLAASAPAVSFENRCRDAEGRYHRIRWTVARDDASGMLLAVGCDVTNADWPQAVRATVGHETVEQQSPVHAQQFRPLIEHSSDLIAILGADGSLNFLNPAFEAVLGFQVQDWLGKSMFDLIWSEDLAPTESLFATSLRSPRKVLPWQLRLRHADGTWRWLEGTGTNRIGDPTIGGVVLTCRDVTQRKRTEEGLRESEERLRQAIRVSNIGIFDHDHLADTIYWSPRQREIYAWGPDEPVTLSDFIGRIHPDDAERISASVKRAHDPSGDGSWDVEHRIIRRDGSVRWLIARSKTFFGGEGTARRPLRTVGAVIDDTDRKLAEQALHIKDQAIATSLNAIAIADGDAKLIYVNPAFLRMWGYASEAEVAGMTPSDFAEPGRTLQIQELVREHSGYQGEILGRRKDGTTFEVMLSANVVRDASGRIVNLMASFLDISDAKRLQAQLFQAQKMESVGRLAGGIAHDFNNLLTVIKGHLDLALADLGPGDQPYQHLAAVSQAAESAATLTQRLLAFSRKQIINPQALNLNDVIIRAQTVLPRVLGEDIELRTIVDPDLGLVRFDHGQCEQILFNLAINARDAMLDGGRLTVETANVSFDHAYVHERPGVQPGNYVMLKVSDTGSGMSADVKAHLFEPFFTTKGPSRGTGLGLPMVYGAVSQNKGWIEVSSDLGRGTSFKIYLPRIHDGRVQRKVQPTGSLPRGTETIILVEDNADVRSFASVVLTRHGYRVHAFDGGTSAIHAIGGMSEPLHLLVTDVIMPEMNGRVVAEQIAKLWPAIKVLFTSGHADDVIVQHGVLREGVEFLPKPYSVESLLWRVREVLDKPGG